MPVIKNFTLPGSAKHLQVPEAPTAKLFLAFISGDDPITKQPWCPDVRAALPHIDAAFTAADAPTVGFVSVGEKAEYVFRLRCKSQREVVWTLADSSPGGKSSGTSTGRSGRSTTSQRWYAISALMGRLLRLGDSLRGRFWIRLSCRLFLLECFCAAMIMGYVI